MTGGRLAVGVLPGGDCCLAVGQGFGLDRGRPRGRLPMARRDEVPRTMLGWQRGYGLRDAFAHGRERGRRGVVKVQRVVRFEPGRNSDPALDRRMQP